MDTVRAFLAFNLDLAATRRVVEVQRQLRAALTAEAGWKVSWVPPPNLHVTLKFFGEIDDTLAAPIRDALEPIIAKRRALRARARGIGSFPKDREPRVLWLGLDDRDAEVRGAPLADLARQIDDRLAEIGFAKETRPFHAHLTLGRVKVAPAGWREALAPFAETDAGQAHVTEVVLFRSDLSRAGAEYHALCRMPFVLRRDG
ncbi:MAG: RNA 2',3'-cyclic phosphodiesterase [Deltaproteobacteria bacterium]|nr:RNA 2',3'-cyclic phosphodiesterase [Deltaproteobacteria bacterium]